MEAIDGQKKETEENIDNNNNLAPLNIEHNNNDIEKLSSNIINSNRKQSLDSNQETIKKTFYKEFGIKEKKVIKTFDYEKLKSIKSCTSYYFGDEIYPQEAYICTICNKPEEDKYMCKYCHEFCHKKCRNTLKEIPKSLVNKEYQKIKSFKCHCGTNLKHTFDIKDKKDLISCNMMELDSILGISPNYCSNHNITICSICSVVCHNECNKNKQNNYLNNFTCQCKSDFHSNFNEFALSFPLEKYKQNADIDVWPVQILNILFNKGKTFNKMSKFFFKFISTDIDFNSPKNIAIINQFKSLLELFSNTFNRKFKTYYYDQQMIHSFEYEKLFSLIKHLEVTNGQTTIIKFRLLFILLFIHLRNDFRIIKSLTSNDFMCNSILQRLIYKKLLKSKMLLNEKINEKYKIREDFPLKKFALQEVCNLMTKGMLYISVEENQDEFEIGLKLICFMLKHLMFNKEDLISLIDSLAIFHDNFYEYIIKENNNIYSLTDIFNGIVEICYMIAINYNDLVIEEYLENPEKEIGKFINVKSEYSVKLLSIVFKNCDLFTRHYRLLIKPNLDDKSEEEQKREKNLRKHQIAMQQKIWSQTTGVSIKMPSNGGIFTDKICNLHNETLCLFCLADNSYQKQLGYIKDEAIQDYFIFSKQLESENYQKNIMEEKGENILCELKLGLEQGYYSLFTSSYIKEKNILKEKLKKEILTACDKIKIRLDSKCQEQNFINMINENQMNNINKSFTYIEILQRNILNEISRSINFASNPLLLTREGRESLVNDLIKVQVDESIFKGFFFLTNIHFPNIINYELVKIFLDFLSLYFLTERGIMYILTGKNIQEIQRLINRFRFDDCDKKKNLNQLKNRTEEFNLNSIKVVIHFLCMISKFVRILEIKTLKKHKSLFKFKKSILSHLKNYVYHIKTNEQLIEFKLQLKEGLEIFNNFYESYNYNQNEEIKNEIMNLFKNNPYNFLDPKSFQKWFDRSQINLNDNNFVKERNNELDYYFQFFEIMTKNSFYIYKNDDEAKKNIEILIKFIDLENLSNLIINNPDLITLEQKSILLKFIRTFYLMDYLDPINILKKSFLLTTKQYKSMIKNNIMNNNDITKENKNFNNDIHVVENNNINNNITNNNITNNNNIMNHRDLYINKLEYIDKLIKLIDLYIKEIKGFKLLNKSESSYNLKIYIEELIFATHEICTKLYYNKNTFNKILPYYYKLILEFIGKKELFIAILQEIEKQQNIQLLSFNNLYDNIKENKEYQYLMNVNFNIFDREELFRYINKAIFDIFKQTKINEEYCLQKYLEMYDVYNEANFPPFSLIEVYDYEYFYQWPEKKEEDEKNEDTNIYPKEIGNKIEKLKKSKESYIDDFKNISKTAFFYILNFESLNKNKDFGAKYVNLFQAFINSTQSHYFDNYRTLLCIMTKILFYNGEHIQELFNDMVYDKYFFKNLNRELNYNIVLCIYLSHKYELCKRCTEITDITKLTIQFLQLLGEGFNTTFHENILKESIKIPEKRKEKNEINKYNEKTYEELNKVDNDESSNSSTSIYDENASAIEQNNEKIEVEKKNEINLIEPKYSIYQTAIFNLKRIFNLMELNTLIEGEAGFDKLCILSTNIIDFLIEYIDTLGDLKYLIDDNFKYLFFFGEEKSDKIKDISNINNSGIIPIFTMRIKDNHENYDEKSYNKYELRKTMLAYMKIKYFQLLKAYLQIGNKESFVNLLLAGHLGPIQLYEEILYYMKELINNLVHKDYEKYHHLLNVDKVNSYKDKLINLYMYEDEFRTSVEISVVFQICIIIAILEEKYRITMLKDHFEKDNSIERNENLADIEYNQINYINNSGNENIFKNLNEFKRNANIQENINNNIKDEVEGSDIFFIDDTNKNLFAKVNNNKNHLYKSNTYYDNIRQEYQRNKLKEIKEEKLKINSKQKEDRHELRNTSFGSKFSKAVYKFLSLLVSKVEIKLTNEENDNEDKKYSINKLTNEISKKIIDYKNEDIVLSNIFCANNLDNNIEFSNNENIIEKEEKEESEDENQKKYVFFIKPYLSFHLSNQSKEYFLYNVDRSQTNIKYKELLSFSDYFLFEMMYNMKYINKSNILKSLSKVSFYYLQIINYLLILAENALLMYHYYRDYSLSYNEYYLESDPDECKRFIDIVIIIIVKLIIIFFAFFIWFYFKFIITYERNVIVGEDRNFIFRRLGQENEHILHPIIFKYFREEGSLLETISLVNEDIGFFNMIKLAVIDSILLNIDINVFVFSFILNIFFLIFGHPLILSIETLFIYGIFPELLNIFKSFIDKFSSLFSCLVFTYLIIYVYNYITIFYMRESFDLGEVLHYDSETFINEPYCYSSLQCFLVLINYGTRSGGGIGDVLPIISYRYDVNFFVGRFIYDMTFFILIIMIMGNVTFGLIVDTFGSLRDDTYKYEEDRKNKCFICQLTRDRCLLKDIDYEKHIKNEHNLWSYVDFLVYLHLYNPNDFNRIEGSVWDKLIERDYGWIPMAEDAGEDDEDD